MIFLHPAGTTPKSTGFHWGPVGLNCSPAARDPSQNYGIMMFTHRNSVDCLGCCWLHPHCLPHFFNYSTQKKSQSPLTGIKSQTKWGFVWKIDPIVKDSHSPFTTIGRQTHNPTISPLWLWLVELSWIQVSGRAVGLWSPFLHFWGGQIPGRARWPTTGRFQVLEAPIFWRRLLVAYILFILVFIA